MIATVGFIRIGTSVISFRFEGFDDGLNVGVVESSADSWRIGTDGKMESSADGCRIGSRDGVGDGLWEGFPNTCWIGAWDGIDDDVWVADGCLLRLRDGFDDDVVWEGFSDCCRIGRSDGISEGNISLDGMRLGFVVAYALKEFVLVPFQ
jgi:hypothetical protein